MKKKSIRKKDVLTALEKSLKTLAYRDSDLIKMGAKEEAINHHLASYLGKYVDEWKLEVTTDAEYNKRGTGLIKNLKIDRRLLVIRPDIIVHARKTDKMNILVVECKKNACSAHDEAKVLGLMRQNYAYKFGAMVSYHPLRTYFTLVFFYKTEEEIMKAAYTISKEKKRADDRGFSGVPGAVVKCEKVKIPEYMR